MVSLQHILGAIVRAFARVFVRREWMFVHSRAVEILAFHRTHPEFVPPLVAQRLLVSAEDHRHGRHPGFDVYGICLAISRYFVSGRREGASTIEQQIVRVITNRFEPTLLRKLREIMLASLFAAHFAKSVSPRVYLAIGYYGWQMNNYTQACRRLRLQPDTLSLDEASAIVARLKYPEPQISPPQRFTQIQQRKSYLKRLYCTHIADGTYHYLGVSNMAKPFEIQKNLKELLAQYPSPEEFRAALVDASRGSREHIVRLWVTEGTPFAFRGCPAPTRKCGGG